MAFEHTPKPPTDEMFRAMRIRIANLIQEQIQAYGTLEPVAMPQDAAPLPSELRPPPEHADKALHWVVRPWCDPTVAEFHTGGWVFPDEWRDASDAYDYGYRYLGPAEWDLDVVDDLKRAIAEGAGTLAQDACDRIKELEAQVVALQAEVAWLNRPFLGAVPPDPLAPVRQHSVKYVPPRRATFVVDDPLPGVESATARERTKLWLREVMPDRLNKEVGFGSPDPSLFGYDLDGSKAEAAWRAGRQDSSVVKGFGSPDPAPAPSVETKPTAPPLPAAALKHGV